MSQTGRAPPRSTIRRARSTDVRLVDPSVSGYHCSLIQTGRGVWVVDLLGGGGVRVNDQEVGFARLQPGDRVLVRPGAKVPTDGVIVEGRTSLDESMLTGESRPVKRAEGDEVIGGSVNGEGAITLEIKKTGRETYLAQVIEMVRRAQESRSRSQNLAEKAAADGFWAREITPVTLPDGTVVATDDCPRPGVTLDAVAGLKPVFRPDGRVTAGNACPLNDGAAALVIMSDAKARDLGVTPLARIVATARVELIEGQ